MPRLVNIRRSVFEEDRRNAAAVREELGRRGVLLVNLIGSPGAGKTTLLEATLRKNTERPEARRFRCAVLEGDVATSRDAERIAALGVPRCRSTPREGVTWRRISSERLSVRCRWVRWIFSSWKTWATLSARRSSISARILRSPSPAFPRETTSRSNIRISSIWFGR